MPISPPTKREAVVRGETVELDAFAVLFGGIAGVAVPAVMGIFLVKLLHIVVAVGLGKDRGGGYRHVFAVAFHYCVPRRKAVRREAVAVHDDAFGARVELVEGAVHRKDRGTQDIDFIDFLRRSDAYAPSQSHAFYLFAQRVAHRRRELLGVVEQFVLIVGRQNNCGGLHAACQAAATGFVAAGFKQNVGIVAGEEHF